MNQPDRSITTGTEPDSMADVGASIEAMVAPLTTFDIDAVARSDTDHLLAAFARLCDPAIGDPPDAAGVDAYPETAHLKPAREAALAGAAATWAETMAQSAAALNVARDRWTFAMEQFSFTGQNAEATLDEAARVAADAYRRAANGDSRSRDAVLNWHARSTILAAMQARDVTATAAVHTLADAVHLMTRAYADWGRATHAATLARAAAEAQAWLNYWQAVEAMQDAV